MVKVTFINSVSFTINNTTDECKQIIRMKCLKYISYG